MSANQEVRKDRGPLSAATSIFSMCPPGPFGDLVVDRVNDKA
jgi:hypothetical protein